jgi:propanol-preferring alcohol dehydrogenase
LPPEAKSPFVSFSKRKENWENLLAIRLHKIGELPTPDKIDIPTVGKGEVLVKVKASGLCSSDVHAIHGIVKTAFLPITLGHEGSGVVESVDGLSGQELSKNDRVVINYPGPCMKCGYCERGNHNLCGKQKIIGFSINGTFSEYIAIDASSVVKLPRNIEFPIGAICGCAVVTAYHALKRGGIGGDLKKPPDFIIKDIAVIGVGGVGYHAILLLNKVFNLKRITAIDISETRLPLAKRAGATEAFALNNQEKTTTTTPPEVAKKIREASADGFGYDTVYDFVGTNSSIGLAIRITRRGGRVVIVGISADFLNTRISDMQFREISLIPSIQHNKSDLEEVLSMVQNGKIDLSNSVTEKFPLSSAREIFEEFMDIKKRKPNSVRTVFIP